MNCTALVTPPDTKTDTQNLGGPRPSGGWQLTTGPTPVRQKPTISQLAAVMDSFGIRGTTRLVSYELLSFWTPGGRVFPKVSTIAGRIGKSERVVQRQLEHLERVGVWVRCGRADVGVKGKQPSLYEMRLPKSHEVTWASPHGVTPTSPRSNQREVTKKNVQRKHCACGNSWPAEFGKTCYRCMKDPPRPLPAPERPKTALTEASEDQLRAVGWRKGKEGAWSRAT